MLVEDADVHPPRALSQTQAVATSVKNYQAMGLQLQRRLTARARSSLLAVLIQIVIVLLLSN